VESTINRVFASRSPFIFNDQRLADGLHSIESETPSTGARMTLRIERSARGGVIVFALSGRIEGEHVEELKRLFKLEAPIHSMVLNLGDVTLVDQDGVTFLAHCEAAGWELTNCPAYIRQWMASG
jgi:hypothetical protein